MTLSAEEAAAAAESEVVEMTWDESTRQYRDERGEIVTKHNSRLSGHRNAQKLVDMTVSDSSAFVSDSMLSSFGPQFIVVACVSSCLQDAVGAELGDMSGTSLPNAAYNTLRKNLQGMEVRSSKRGGKKGGTVRWHCNVLS